MNTAIPVIETKRLNCKAGYRYLLNDINWTVNKGEHWLIFGMNGCGKTTLLSILAGFRAYTGGTLKVFGESYCAENILEMRRKIGFISSSFFDKVLSKESVLDIVLAGKYGTIGLNALPENRDIIHAKALLRELHLKDKINRPFHLLSKGERQNVLITRALMGQPEMLVLDEPGTGLDVFAREYMLSTVKDLAENTDMTIVYVTHYTEEILDNFDKCMLMRNGRVFQLGNTRDLFTESYISDFLEYPVRIEQHGDRMQLRLNVKSRIREIM